MRKILAILLSGVMCFSLAACSGQNNKTTDPDIVIDFDKFEDVNKDEAVLNDIESTIPQENEEEFLTQNKKETVTTPQFEEYFEVGDGLLFKDDKFEMVMYDRNVLEFKSAYKRGVNGVNNSVVDFSSDFLNFNGVSWPSTKEAVNGFKIISYEEALTFEDDYSDITSCVSGSWVEEKFSEDKIYVLVNSTTFDRLFSAFPTAEYDAENNVAYLIFEKEHEHWYSTSWDDKEKVEKESNSTSTLLILDRADVDNLDKIYIVTPEQFVEEDDIEEKEIEIAWGISNEDELIQEDNNGISYMLFKSNVEFPQGILEVSIEEARDFIDTYLDKGNEAQINIETFINANKIFIINDRHASDATELETNLRALERAGRLYIEMYSDQKANDDGRNVIVVGLGPELYEKYENFSFVIDD